METIYLSEKKLKCFSKLKLDEIEHDESNLYKYNNSILLKIFKNSNKELLKNKMDLINKLFYLKKYIQFNMLIYPETYIKINNVKSGYSMKYIKDNINGKILLSNNNISIEEQLDFLKSIYNTLEKIENNDILKENDFHLSDIHEANFILDKRANKLHVVDIDSSYINGLVPQKSKFLTYNDKLYNNLETKYPYNDKYIHIPNYNTTILSYIYILINYITQKYSPDFSKNEFCETLNIMSSVGFEKEICDAIYNIYKTSDNYFDLDFFKSITPKLILKYREVSKNNKKF